MPSSFNPADIIENLKSVGTTFNFKRYDLYNEEKMVLKSEGDFLVLKVVEEQELLLGAICVE